MTYNIALKRVYKKPQNSSFKKDWSKRDKFTSIKFHSILAEKNLPNRVIIGS